MRPTKILDRILPKSFLSAAALPRLLIKQKAHFMSLSLFISELNNPSLNPPELISPPPLFNLCLKENFLDRWKIFTEFEIEILSVLNRFPNLKADGIAKHLKRTNDATLRTKLADLKEKLIITSSGRTGYVLNL